ncbi:MAG: tetratricopeptide repeat protein [Candidatus Omnitrophica bacterium]|nr:tetratricopeptide repeat protein [Candidatus Omnitrophota bacterium]
MGKYWKIIIVAFLTLTLLGGCSTTKPNAGELGDQGLKLEREGKLDQAIEKYSQAIEVNPQSLGFRLMRVNAYMTKGNFDSAIEDYTEIIRLFPEQYGATGYFERGRAYEAKGDNEHAIADFEKAISLSSDSKFVKKVQQELAKLK